MHLLICNGPVTEKGVTKMRDTLIKEILELTEEEVKLFLALLEQFAEQEEPVQLPHQTSA